MFDTDAFLPKMVYHFECFLEVYPQQQPKYETGYPFARRPLLERGANLEAMATRVNPFLAKYHSPAGVDG